MLQSVKRLTKFKGRYIRFLFEKRAKGLRVLKAEGIGNFADRKIGRGKFFFGFSDQFFMNMLLCILAGVNPKQVAEVVWRQVHLRSNILYGEQTGYVVVIIVIDQLLEPGEQGRIIILTGQKLPFIKTVGVFKQTLDLR